MGDLNGKTMFLSGGSRGIGLAIAKRAAKDGANIIIAAKTAEPHPKLPGTIYSAAAEIEEAGGKALPVICDIRDDKNVEEAVAAGIEKFGGIDICEQCECNITDADPADSNAPFRSDASDQYSWHVPGIENLPTAPAGVR